MRIFLFFILGIISFGARVHAAGPVYACLPCPTGIDCPAGTTEAGVAGVLASQHTKDGSPVGSITALAVYRGTEFDGWLYCNGQNIPAGTKYNALRSLLGSTYGSGKVPNFQGYFLRGAGGSAAAIGTAQGDAIRNITGYFGENIVAALDKEDAILGGAFYAYNSKSSSGDDQGRAGYNVGFDASRVVPTAYENRPVNYAVYYYIKY